MSLLAGFATAPITPAGPVALAGYGDRQGHSTGVHRDLDVRALVLGDGDQVAALVVFDLLAMSPDWSTPIREAVAAELGCPLAAVVTSCDHVHAGPSALSGSDPLGWAPDPAYRDVLVARATAAAGAARDRAEAVEARFVAAPLPDGLAVNRRGHPYAPSLAALELRRPDGSRVGIVANLGIHPVVTGPANREVSTDWIGAFRDRLEEAGGTAVFLQGCEADVNPAVTCWEGTPEEWFGAADDLGRRLAGAVGDALDAAAPIGTGLTCHRRVVSVPTGPSALTMLLGHVGDLEVELVEWTIGGLRLVTVPGEGSHALARRIEDARGGPVLIAGLAPCWQGYLPLPFTEGYEEGVSYGQAAVLAIADALEVVP